MWISQKGLTSMGHANFTIRKEILQEEISHLILVHPISPSQEVIPHKKFFSRKIP